tara:strand:+ start:738 stop:890 length:153 start_codon:yes stop_codon:yes gene_type:complete
MKTFKQFITELEQIGDIINNNPKLKVLKKASDKSYDEIGVKTPKVKKGKV